MSDEKIIELDGGDGEPVRCGILDFVTFGEKEYAVLLKLDTDEAVVMEFVQQGEQGVFRTIEDDAEFDAVAAFVRELAEQANDRDA